MRISPERGFIDHLLAIVACMTSSYAIAISINKQELALFLAAVVGLSCLAGYGLSATFEGTRLINADGWLFTVAAVFAVGVTRNVNAMLPEEGFPFQIIASVILWLIMVGGGLFSWRDGTLLFLSLPGIALFGLVGVINDAISALALFCLFIVSVAVLYARVHQRYMLQEAAKSGADTRLLWRDAWRWVAGPEWAFAAAGFVILISLVAAPVVRFSLSGVSSQVSQNVQNQVSQAVQQQSPFAQAQADNRIGQGPISLDETELFRIKLDRPRLLRTQIFMEYTGQGWNELSGATSEYLTNPENNRRRSTPRFDSRVHQFSGVYEIDFELKMQVRPLNPKVFAPGLVSEGPDIGRYTMKNGITSFTVVNETPALYRFKSFVTDMDAMPDPITSSSGSTASSSRIPRRVAELAQTVTAGAPSDFIKARRLQVEITRRAKYNLRAPATPANADPVDHFLFESQEGYCDLFASSMVLMARAAGLQARYVVGYLVNDPTTDSDGFFTVRGKDYHAWAEVYFPEHGWVPFDPSEGAEEIAGAGRGASVSPWEIFLASVPWSRVLTYFSLAVAIAVAAYWLLKGRRMQPELTTGTRGEVVQLQNRFQRAIEGHSRRPRRFSQTIREYIGFISPDLQSLSPQAQHLAQKFEAGMFGRNGPDKESLRSLRQETKEFLTELKRLPKTKP